MKGMYVNLVTIIGETLSGIQKYHFIHESNHKYKQGDLLYSDTPGKDFGNRDFTVTKITQLNEVIFELLVM